MGSIIQRNGRWCALIRKAGKTALRVYRSPAVQAEELEDGDGSRTRRRSGKRERG